MRSFTSSMTWAIPEAMLLSRCHRILWESYCFGFLTPCLLKRSRLRNYFLDAVLGNGSFMWVMYVVTTSYFSIRTCLQDIFVLKSMTSDNRSDRKHAFSSWPCSSCVCLPFIGETLQARCSFSSYVINGNRYLSSHKHTTLILKVILQVT